MHSKKIKTFFKIILSFSLLLGLVQCSYFFDEKKKEKEIVYESTVGSCVGDVNKTIGAYFAREQDSPEVSDEDIRAFGDCYVNSIESFATYTKSGRVESDAYSAENIELLFKKFHPEVNMDAERIRGYIRLKSFLIGGEEDTISREELKALQKMVPTLVDGLVKLKPYRRIWLNVDRVSRDQKGFDLFNQAFGTLKKQIGFLLTDIENYRGNRDIDLVELSQFMFKELAPSNYIEKFKYLTLIEKFKNFAVLEQGKELNNINLSLFARQSVLTYELILKYQNFLESEEEGGIFENIGHVAIFVTRVPNQLKDSSLFRGVGLKALGDIIRGSEAVLNYSLLQRNGGKMEMGRFGEVLLALEEAEIMKGPLTARTLNYFLHQFSEKWLDPGAVADSSITEAKVRYVKSAVTKWISRQEIANWLYAHSEGGQISLVRPDNKAPHQKLMKEWFEVLKSGDDDRKVSTHQWDARSRVRYTDDLSNFSYEELTVANSVTILAEVFMKPFNTNESNPLLYKVTEDEAQQIYEVNRSLGVEMAFMDSRIEDSGRRSFSETNNFSTQVRSDNYLDFYEGFEYLTVAMSAGTLADWIHADISQNEECLENLKGVHRRRLIKAPCFRGHMRQNFMKYFGHLTTVKRYWDGANELDRTLFLRTMEVASRSGLIKEKPYDLGEVRVAVSIMSYLESIFYSFDREHRNGLADGIETTTGDSELRRAEVHFRNLIIDFLAHKKPEVMVANRDRLVKHCGVDPDPTNILISEMKDDEGNHYQLSKYYLSCFAPKIFIHLLRQGNLPLAWTNTCQIWSFAGDGLFRKGVLAKEDEEKAFQSTQANPHDVFRVFSALSKITLGSHRNRVKKFLMDNENRSNLLESLGKDHSADSQRTSFGLVELQKDSIAPDCRENPEEVFCKWSRIIYCNANIIPEVFEYFSEHRTQLFDRPRFAENPEVASHNLMVDIFESFDADFEAHNGDFENLCAFPPTFERRLEETSGEKIDRWIEDKAGDIYEDCIGGDEDATWSEWGAQKWESTKEGAKDTWDGVSDWVGSFF